MAKFKLFRFKKGKISADSVVADDEVLDNKLHFKSGQTIVFNEICLVGLVTGSTKYLRFTLPLPREIDSMDDVEITSCYAELRGDKGYVNSESGFHEYVGRSGYTVAPVLTSDSTINGNHKMKYIVFEILKTTAYTNITNNTPATFWGNITLKIK